MTRAGSGPLHKVVLLGLGTMGKHHARVLAGLPDRFELVGGYDVRPDVPTPRGVRRLASEAEAVACCEVAVVATPIGAHAPAVARALAAGRHVLAEKPLCDTAAAARALAAVSARGPARLFVGHSERFNPVVRAVARLVRGERVLAMDFQRVGPSRSSECGVLANLGVHDLDLAAYLSGGSVSVRSARGGEDFADVVFETSTGAAGRLAVGRVAPERRRTLTLTTSRWVYEGDLLAHRLVRAPRDGGPRADVPLLLEEPLVAQALALADALEGAHVRELATASDGAAAVALAEVAAAQCNRTAPAGVPAENLSLRSRP